MRWLVVVFCASLFYDIAGQKSSPCPEIFNYDQSSYRGRWDGHINLKTDVELAGVFVTIVLDQEADRLVNWFGESTTRDRREFIIRNTDYILVPGIHTTIKFYVEFSRVEVPSVTTIRLNGRAICSDRKIVQPTPISNPFISVIVAQKPTAAAQYEQDISILDNNYRVPQKTNSESRHEFISANRTIDLTVIKPDVTFQNSFNKCGKPISVNSTSHEGNWPWHVALYLNSLGELRYKCGGSVISNTFVITAAHCLMSKQAGQMISANNYLMYIGTLSLNDFSSMVHVARISKMTIHPKFSQQTYNNNIAVLKTVKPIVFNSYVQRVCLPPNSDSPNVGDVGTVIGWGLDEKEKEVVRLRVTEMPIVDDNTCIALNPSNNRYLSVSTFCAGFRNGSSSPCNRDAGSGMVISKRDGHGKVIWYLRGIVSISLLTKTKNICDPEKYVVFTDVARHLEWIDSVTSAN